MLRKVLSLAAVIGALAAPAAFAETTQQETPIQSWSFNGPLGMYDQEQLQRGFKVYEQVCSACHSINYIHFYNLGEPGGPFWSDNPKYADHPNDNPWVKAIAAGWPRPVPMINPDTGDETHRPAATSDVLVGPFANDAAARGSNGGALPPDMSLLVNAREGGPNYVAAVAGFNGPAPAGLDVPPGKYYNPFVPGDVSGSWHGDPTKVPPGSFISMPPPLTDCKVTFDDGKPCKTADEARDVSAFLQWAADPKMNERKQLGAAVMVYLGIFSVLLYLSYRAIWRNIEH
jgi:ubiquinol-cytochrome c reductase cytochrome c1 subunit